MSPPNLVKVWAMTMATNGYCMTVMTTRHNSTGLVPTTAVHGPLNAIDDWLMSIPMQLEWPLGPSVMYQKLTVPNTQCQLPPFAKNHEYIANDKQKQIKSL